MGEKIIYTAPKAVVEISEAEGAKTPPRTAATCSPNALRVAPDIPLGSTPAAGDAVLGSQNAFKTHDLNQTPPEPELSADISMPSTCVRDHFSTDNFCPDVAVNVTEKANDGRAEFFRYMCDRIPRNTSIPLPFDGKHILDLYQTVAFHEPEDDVDFSCVFPWTRELRDMPKRFLRNIWLSCMLSTLARNTNQGKTLR